MCGIMGVLGRAGATGIVHRGLATLEYRGYDSCGVAWLDDGVKVARAVGAVANLHVDPKEEDIALGHTRWATHGGVKEENAHPHLDNQETIAVVHNGVLLNHRDIRAKLEADGAVFRGETDSECLAHMWSRLDGDGLSRLRQMKGELDGTYSIAFLDKASDAIYVAKHRNPLWLAVADGITYFASDAVALRPYTKAAVALEDGDHGVLHRGSFTLYDADGLEVERDALDISAMDDHVDKAGYEHFMLKEIHEIPAVLNKLVSTYVRQQSPWIELGIDDAYMKEYRSFLGLGAGTSHHAAILGDEYHERLAFIPGEARPTPEYKDDLDVPRPDTLILALSQSGETLDTLQAIHRLRSHGLKTIAFTNQPQSSIGRAAQYTLPLMCGVEVSVAATKSFISQCTLNYLLAMRKASVEGNMTHAEMAYQCRQLIQLPRALSRTIHREDEIREVARKLTRFESLFLLAKGLHLPAAMEGALKLKEIAYQHAEAYPAGELKHGPFALLTSDTAVIFLLAPDDNHDAIMNALHEVHARGAYTVVIAMEGATDPGDSADAVVWVPKTDHLLTPFVFSTAMHELSYWVAKARGLPIDKPRNLAKSVTVE